MVVADRTRWRRIRLVVAAGVVAVMALVGSPGGHDSSGASAASDGETAARYRPLTAPVRVLDTRSATPIDRLPADSGLSIAPVTDVVADAAGVEPAAVVAVVANVTMVGVDGPGWAAVYPTGETRPEFSSINTDRPGQTIANLVTARLGASGMITISSSTGTDVLVDVLGVYERSSGSAGGRYVALEPTRVEDTRETARPGAGGSLSIDLTDAGVPTTASAAVVNVTATGVIADGFVTVWAPDTNRPDVSNLNVGVGVDLANQVIARTVDGRINVYTSSPTHVLVDVVGYMTGEDATSDTAGLFVATTPTRLLDTRRATPTGGDPVGPDGTVRVATAGHSGIPAVGVASVATNLTVTDTETSGFVTAWAGQTARPGTSNQNWSGSARTVANHAIVPAHTGSIDVYGSARAHVIVDVTGYHLDGTVTPPTSPAPPPLDLTDRTIAGPTPQPSTAPASGPHEFLYTPTNPPGRYGRWDPCRNGGRIVYAVNAARATQTHIDLMHAAMRTIEEATGFDFVPASPVTTDEGLDSRRPPTGADVLIGFSDAGATPRLAGRVLGIGGGVWFTRSAEIDTGYVVVDVVDLGRTDAMQTTLLHEMAHMIGLDHVDDPTEVMFGMNLGRTTLGPGDREGMWRLGTAQPCLPQRGDPGPLVRTERAVGATPSPHG